MPARPRDARRTAPSRDPEEALLSPRRIEVMLALRAHGRGTVAELGRWTGVRPTALYAHLTVLEDAGLVRVRGRGEGSAADGVVVEPVGAVTAVRYDPDDPASVDRTCRYTRQVLRHAATETCRAFDEGRPRVRGKRRQAAVGYVRTWLAPDELARANALLDELHALFTQAREPEGREAFALTFALRPAVVADRA